MRRAHRGAGNMAPGQGRDVTFRTFLVLLLVAVGIVVVLSTAACAPAPPPRDETYLGVACVMHTDVCPKEKWL